MPFPVQENAEILVYKRRMHSGYSLDTRIGNMLTGRADILTKKIVDICPL